MPENLFQGEWISFEEKAKVQIMSKLQRWLDAMLVDLFRAFRWSFLPPLMIYFAAGVSGLTAIVGTFFVKEYLGLPASFLAGLVFWAGLPWALKMPLGHLVDIIWRWKSYLVLLGAALITTSLMIMYALIRYPEAAADIMPIESWYVLSFILAPCGYVVQDAVADAMSVEAVPSVDGAGRAISDEMSKFLHTTMQTLGRIALISGLIAVALLNIFMFDGVEAMRAAEKANVYGRLYLIALMIPAVSISGVVFAAVLKKKHRNALAHLGYSTEAISDLIDHPADVVETNHWYFTGGLAFATIAVLLGVLDIPFSKEIVFVSSMAIVVWLIFQLVEELDPSTARALFGTAIIIFVFRAVPLPGPGLIWFEIDVLEFDQQFLSILTLIISILTLIGMVILRPLMATKSIAYIVVLLSIVGAVLSLPNIGLYYGLHHWTATVTGGIVDARFIALVDAAIESPLGQIAMIPMLAWIAKNAPVKLKATFFAVMASFTNLALSASGLLTKCLNDYFLVTREVRNRYTGVIEIAADYSALGWLLVAVALIALVAPLLSVLLIQSSRLRTSE